MIFASQYQPWANDNILHNFFSNRSLTAALTSGTHPSGLSWRHMWSCNRSLIRPDLRTATRPRSVAGDLRAHSQDLMGRIPPPSAASELCPSMCADGGKREGGEVGVAAAVFGFRLSRPGRDHLLLGQIGRAHV